MACIREILEASRSGDLVVLPEGALSGYDEDPQFLRGLDREGIAVGIEHLAHEARERDIHLFFGTCLLQEEGWFNTGIYLGPHGERFIYRKVNLATREREVFTPGRELPTLDLDLGGSTLRVGIQLCRESRYPEQWRHLARRGAGVIVYMTNAVGSADDLPVWRSHLISRAAENQRFVLSSNNAHAEQKCPTAIVTPSGRVLAQTGGAATQTLRATLDLGLISNWYLDQARNDVVDLLYRPVPQ